MSKLAHRTRYPSIHASTYALSRFRARNRDKKVSLGTFAGLLAILAPFAGYLLAYGWRSGEAQFYGIKQELIGISLDDCFRFAFPLALVFICMAVVTRVDLGKKRETGNAPKKRRSGVIGCAIGFVVSAILSVVLAYFHLSPWSLLVLIASMLLLVATLIFLMSSVLSLRTSRFAFGAIAVSYFVEILFDGPIATSVVVIVLAFTLLSYLGKEGMLSAKRGITPVKVNLVMPYCALGGALLGAAFLFATISGFNAAGFQQHIVLDSREVVLTTYSGDRSVIASVDEEGNISTYRIANLSDESQPWTVKKPDLKGKPLFDFM